MKEKYYVFMDSKEEKEKKTERERENARGKSWIRFQNEIKKRGR